MTNTYELVEIAKNKKNISSDNALAVSLGFTRQNINDWKTGRSEPKGTNLLKLIIAAELSIEEALELMTEKPMKEAGFANVELMAGMGAMSLFFVTADSPSIALALISSPALCILC